MSLTLPSNYESASKNSNIKENWLYQLFNNDSYLSFDGSNDYIDLGTTTANSAINVKGVSASGSGISVSFFINFPETGSREPIFASNSTATYSGYWIEKDANDKINFNWGDDSGAGSQDRRTMTSNTVLSANTWYHVLITSTFANPTSGTDIYINNSASALSASGTATVTTPTYVSDGKAYIAREDFTATNYGGKLYIKNLAIWSGVLDSNNRTAIYNSGNYKSLLYNFGNYNQVSNLKGYWELNNGEPVINDLSGNGLHGTINGATYGGYLPLSTTDTLVDDVFYHGVVTKTGSIRDSIDLQNSKAKTSNVSFSIANFKYKGSDISSKLFLGDIEYINYNVKIYSQLNNNSSLSNCLQIYQGRLINVSHNDSSVSIQLTEKRPWDFLSIPTEKTTQKNIYIPISYGNYTKNSATTFESPLFESELSSKAYRPVPLNKTFSDKILYVDGNNTSSDGQLAVYEKSVDTFVPLENAIASTVNTDNAEHSQSDLSQLRSFKQRAESVEVSSNDGVTITNAEKAFDGDSNTYANYSIDIDGQEGAVRIRLDYDFHSVSGKSSDDFKILRSATNLRVLTAEGLTDTETDLNIDDATNVSVHDVIKVDDEQIIVNSINSNELDDITRGFNSKKESHDDDVLIRLNNTVTVLGLTYQIDVNRSGDDVGNNTVRTRGDISVGFTSNDVSKRTIYTHFSNNTTSATFEIEFDLNEIEPLLPSFDAEFRIYDIFLHTQRVSEAPEEMLYVANDGLTESYSGSADLVEHGHEALRDILTRFVGLDTSTPDGWSDLHTDRHIDNWKIRYWTLEPKDIQTILDKITYEFGFIFKYRADATSRVIYIKQSSELSASQTLTNRDIKNIQVSMSGFNNVISKMIINYQKHPAIKEYIANITSSNDEVRTKYKIQSQENTKEIKLDMNVGTPASTPQSDPNADFYSYYNNIIGDVKKIIKCEIVNSNKSYNLETGDIVKFDDMPVNPFGHNWNESGSQYYMITSLNRSIGSVSIECREVG
jgi:hypothetical protein